MNGDSPTSRAPIPVGSAYTALDKAVEHFGRFMRYFFPEDRLRRLEQEPDSVNGSNIGIARTYHFTPVRIDGSRPTRPLGILKITYSSTSEKATASLRLSAAIPCASDLEEIANRLVGFTLQGRPAGDGNYLHLDRETNRYELSENIGMDVHRDKGSVFERPSANVNLFGTFSVPRPDEEWKNVKLTMTDLDLVRNFIAAAEQYNGTHKRRTVSHPRARKH